MLDKAPTGKVSDLLNAPTRNGELTVLQRDYVHDYAAGRGNPRPFCCLCLILSTAHRIRIQSRGYDEDISAIE